MSGIRAVGEGLAELRVEPGGTATLSPGGDIANIAVMAARMGAHTHLVGRIGADALGAFLLGAWERAGVDVRAIRRDPRAPTGLYVNETLPGGSHRYTYWRSGSAGSHLEPEDLDGDFPGDAAIIVVSGITLAISESAAAAAESVMNPARAKDLRIAFIVNYRSALGGETERLAAAARRSDVVIASAEDCEAVFETSDPIEVTEALGDFPTEVVLTNGGLPATLVVGGTLIRQVVPSVPVTAAGGAGDALAGAYLAGRLRDTPPATALTWGVAAATLSVQRPGCADSYPTARQVRALASRLPALVREPLRSSAAR